MQLSQAGPDTEPSTLTEPLDDADSTDADDSARIVTALYGDGEPDEIAMWTAMERRRRREQAGSGPTG